MKILVDELANNISECVFFNTVLFEPILKKCHGECKKCKIFMAYEQYDMLKQIKPPKVDLFDFMCACLDVDKDSNKDDMINHIKPPTDEPVFRV